MLHRGIDVGTCKAQNVVRDEGRVHESSEHRQSIVCLFAPTEVPQTQQKVILNSCPHLKYQALVVTLIVTFGYLTKHNDF